MRSSADASPLARSLAQAADDILAAAPAVRGELTVIVIDGRSGAGKTSLARELVARTRSASLLMLDDIYPGWDGLAEATAVLATLLADVRAGRPGRWRAWDWDADDAAGERTIVPGEVLVVEGAGSLSPSTADAADVSVWLDAPAASRRDRALRRDGDTYLPHWERWARQEDAHIARHAPRQLADIVIDLP
ncbi:MULTISPECIES: hypothetical protein [unclassified Microbacterium]|uniref:hypothetical protein n=1 Tax=unclassified Microbacterium TaxID=2609290 RepID=UPI0038662BF4